jgi:hypothetical protein
LPGGCREVAHRGSGAFLLILLGLAGLVTGCGIGFGAGTEGTELFARLTIEGERITESPLTLRLDYTQIYPASIDVRCFLEQDEEEVQIIGDRSIPPHSEGGPEATPTPGAFSLEFTVSEPGGYRAVCETPADENNAISKPVEIRSAEP